MKKILNKKLIFFVITLISISLILYISFNQNIAYAEDNIFTLEELKNVKENEPFFKNGKKYVLKDNKIYEIVTDIEETVKAENKIINIDSIGTTKSFDSASKPNANAYLYSLVLAIPKQDKNIVSYVINDFTLKYNKYNFDILVGNELDPNSTNVEFVIKEQRGSNGLAFFAKKIYYSDTISPSSYYPVNINSIEKIKVNPAMSFKKPWQSLVKGNEIVSRLNKNTNGVYTYKNVPLNPKLNQTKKFTTNQKIEYVNWSQNLNWFSKLLNLELFKKYSDKNITINNFTKLNDTSVNEVLSDNISDVKAFYTSKKSDHDVYVLHFDFLERERLLDGPEEDYTHGLTRTSYIKDYTIYQNVEAIKMNVDVKTKTHEYKNKEVFIQNKPVEVIAPDIPKVVEPELPPILNPFKDKWAEFKKVLKYIGFTLITLIVIFILSFVFKLLAPLFKGISFVSGRSKRRKRRKNE